MNNRRPDQSPRERTPAPTTDAAVEPGKGTQVQRLPVQRRARSVDAGKVQQAAEQGISTPSGALPHGDAIQRSFGPEHDVSGIQAHVGGLSAAACGDMGAYAFATGSHVAFADQPDLHTAAHEAAHVVQQARGVNLYGHVGEAGDSYERHADAVADRVVAGRSASDLLDQSPSAADGVYRDQIQGTEAPNLQATPQAVRFGGVTVGTPASQVVKVKNLGGDLSLGDVVISSGGSAFTARVHGETTLHAGQTTSVIVDFRPTDLGVQKASITVTNEEGDGTPTFDVSGAGTAGPVAEPPKAPAQPQGKGKDAGHGKVKDVKAPPAQAPVGPATVEDDDAQATVVAPIPVVSNPAQIDFGTVDDTVDSVVGLTNTSDAAVSIDRAEVMSGGQAFTIVHLSAKTIQPGQFVELAVEYHPNKTTVEGAAVAVTLSSGHTLYIPITAPAHAREIAHSKAGVLRIAPDPVVFEDLTAPSKKTTSYNTNAYGQVAVTNPSMTPQLIESVQFDNAGKSNFSAYQWKPTTIAPGETQTVELEVIAQTAGDLKGTGALMTADGRSIGTFGVGVHVESAEWMDPANPKAITDAEKHWKKTKDPQILQARNDADAPFEQLQHNSAATLAAAMSSLSSEWLEYLHATASNPSISSAELGGESLLGQILEHTLAGGVAKNVEHKIEHVAGGGAGHGAAHGAGDAAAHGAGDTAAHGAGDAAAHGAGKTAAHGAGDAAEHAAEKGVATAAVEEGGALIAGAVIGFAVGVLIETVGGLIYHWLSGEDDEIKKELKKAWDEGFLAGNDALYKAFSAKSDQLQRAQQRATYYQLQKELQYKQLIGSTTDPKQMARIVAEIQAQADLADPANAKVEKGLSQTLLQHWVRDHAADSKHGAKDVNQDQWKEARRVTPDGDMPDLFVDQAIHEWTERGLKPNASLGPKMRAEVVSPSNQESDADRNAAQAKRAMATFTGREFTFGAGDDWSFFAPPHPTNIKHVSSYLDLKDEGGTTSVRKFIYAIEMDDGSVRHGSAEPGAMGPIELDSTNDAATKPTPGPKASAKVYALMTQLQSQGVAVAQVGSSSIAFLRSTFGDDVGDAHVQEGSGAAPSVQLFHVVDDLVLTDNKADVGAGERMLSWATYNSLYGGYERRENGEFIMLRGGDTILWMRARRPKHDG